MKSDLTSHNGAFVFHEGSVLSGLEGSALSRHDSYVRAHPARTGFAPTRSDVAMFVGQVRRRPGPLPIMVDDWLLEAGYLGNGPRARSPEQLDNLLDIPVPVESWDMFERLFAWNERPVEQGSDQTVSCRLALAVRSFFAEGGRKAYIVRTGDPLPLVSKLQDRAAAQNAWRNMVAWSDRNAPVDAGDRVPLIPGYNGHGPASDIGDPATWTGAAHIFGLKEVAFLLLPDLPELLCGPADGGRSDLPPSEWPNFYFRIGHEGGMEWRGSTSRKRSSASCVKRRSCWRRAERWRMHVAGLASPSRATTAGAKSMAA